MAVARISAVVLAAGTNRRFVGEHSAPLAEWRGHTLIEDVLETACNARVSGLVSEVAVLEPARRAPRALVWAHYSGLADPVNHPALVGRDHFRLVHRMEDEKGFHAATERLGLRWVEVAVEADNPEIDYAHDLGRLT